MAVTFAIDQVGLAPAGVAGEAREDGLAADVGGGLAAEVTVTTSGAPVGSVVVVALLDVPQLPTPDTNAAGSLAETPPLSGIWKFTPSALRYGKFRIRTKATLLDGTTQELIRTFSFASPTAGLHVPALNERGDRTASLVNQGAAVLANTESNKGTGATGFRAWHRWMLRISKLVEDLVAGGGGGGGLTPTDVKTADYTAAAGELVVVDCTVPVVVTAPASPAAGQRFGVLTVGPSLMAANTEADTTIDGGDAAMIYAAVRGNGGGNIGKRAFRGAGFRADFFFDGMFWRHEESGNLDGTIVARFDTARNVPFGGAPVTFFTLVPWGYSLGDVTYRWEVDVQADFAGDTLLGKLQALIHVVSAGPVITEHQKLFITFDAEPPLDAIGVAFDVSGGSMKLQVTNSSVDTDFLVSLRGRVYSSVIIDLEAP